MKLEKVNISLFNKYKEDFSKYILFVLEENFNGDLTYEANKSIENMEKFINDESAYIIGAFEEEKLIGFIWAYKKLFNRKEKIHISYLFVDSNFRRQGIASKLFKCIVEYAHKNNIKELELMVTNDNKNAINFYEKLGFSIERLNLCKVL